MKTNKINIKNYKLFRYNLLKLQIYSNQHHKTFTNFSNSLLEQIEAFLKQMLKVIFEYHVCHSKILFIGFPVISKARQMKLIHFTNHSFISDKSWVSGVFRNRLSVITYLKLIQSQNFSKSVKLLLKIKTKPHLVVLFNQKVETDTINEFYKLGIPILSFNWNSLHNFKVAYGTLGNFNFIERNIKLTFFYLFYSLLKKTPLKKRKVWRQPLKTVRWNPFFTSNLNIYAFYKKTA